VTFSITVRSQQPSAFAAVASYTLEFCGCNIDVARLCLQNSAAAVASPEYRKLLGHHNVLHENTRIDNNASAKRRVHDRLSNTCMKLRRKL
jgi:hypothetical protein